MICAVLQACCYCPAVFNLYYPIILFSVTHCVCLVLQMLGPIRDVITPAQEAELVTHILSRRLEFF